VTNAQLLAVLCVVVSVGIAAALNSVVPGFELPASSRYGLTVALPVLAALIAILPPVGRVE